MLRIRGPGDASFLHFQIKAACSLFKKRNELTIRLLSINRCYDIIIFRNNIVTPFFRVSSTFLPGSSISFYESDINFSFIFNFVIRYGECNVFKLVK